MSSSKVVPSDTKEEESVELSVRQKIRKKSIHYDASKREKRKRKQSLSMKSPLARENRFAVLHYEDNENVSDDQYVVDSLVPSGEIETILNMSLDSHFLFAEFTTETMKKFISMMQCERFESGTKVCEQGQFGHKFYVVVKGKVEIHKDGLPVEVIGVGDNFGDVSLLHTCSRVYTAVTVGQVELWSIKSRPFRDMLKQNQSTKLLQIGEFLRKNKLFTSLNENQIAIAAEAFVLQTFQNDTLIIQEGDSDVGVFYILISGKVRVTQQGRFVRDMLPGVVFGARSLIQKESRTATCRAVGRVECYAATREHFEKVLEIPLKNAINSKARKKSSTSTPPSSNSKTSDIDSKTKSERKSTLALRTMRRSWSAGDVPNKNKPVLSKSSKPSHFKSIGILGRGGFGLVILAAHRASGSPVVLKICTSTTSKAYMVASRERELLGRLNHRNIVSKLNAYERKGTKEITLVLEYLPGGDLFSLLLARKTFSMEMTRFYTACAYFALIHMHSRNILCRDLKLENMAIARDGNLKLIDLGLAKCSTKKCYTVCGSPEIISPEMISNTGYYTQVDFWALGVLVHEMAVGRAPFGDRNSYSSVHRSVLQYSRRRRAMKRKVTEFDAIQQLLPWLADSKQGYTTASFVYRLLHPQPSLRLGCTSRRKIDFEGHMFFQSPSWNWKSFAIGKQKIPYVPKLDSAFDMTYFDKSTNNEDDFAMLNHAMRDDESDCCVVS